MRHNNTWVNDTTQHPVAAHTASAFGVLAAAVKQAGRSPRPRCNDLWIAAQAIEYGHTLLTLNAKDFTGLPGLLVTVIELKPSGWVWAPERRCLEFAGLKGPLTWWPARADLRGLPLTPKTATAC